MAAQLDPPPKSQSTSCAAWSDALQTDEQNICHKVAYFEANDKRSDVQPLVDELQRIFLQWREEQ